MKKQVLLLWALTGAAMLPAYAQTGYETRPVVLEPKNAPVAKRQTAAAAEYAYPVGLRNLGMISSDDNACCSFLSFNTAINGDAYMWAPMNETVTYVDNSSVSAVDYHWYLPGADATELETQDADATYNTPGIYDFPTMTVKERRKPEIIKGSRKKRIAAGAGVSIQEVNRLLKQFEEARYMMRRMGKGGMKKMMGAMKGMMGMGGMGGLGGLMGGMGGGFPVAGRGGRRR